MTRFLLLTALVGAGLVAPGRAEDEEKRTPSPRELPGGMAYPASSNFDRFDINPNTAEPYGDHALSRRLLAERLRAGAIRGEPQSTRFLVAANAVFLERDRTTRVILPVVPLDHGD